MRVLMIRMKQQQQQLCILHARLACLHVMLSDEMQGFGALMIFISYQFGFLPMMLPIACQHCLCVLHSAHCHHAGHLCLRCF
jgi:hypothetical protein